MKTAFIPNATESALGSIVNRMDWKNKIWC